MERTGSMMGLQHEMITLVVAVNFKRQMGIKLRLWGINLTRLLK